MTPLPSWENFYVIVGSSAGALIGLQFVVIALLADMPVRRGQEQAGEAFGTPTVVHFGMALLLSAILSAPWHRNAPAIILWGLAGVCGVVYQIIVLRRMLVQTLYKPVFEDWLFHALLPLAAYATLAGSAFPARFHAVQALFAVAAAALLLLFIGIHNAWDAVTYHVYSRKPEQRDATQGPPE